MAANGLAIDLADVAKVYKGRVHALQGIALQVKPGEIFGLLGPNGAGKSTLVKIMMTVVRPTRAAGTILGHPVGHKATLGKVGYLPEHHRFPRYLTGRQTLEFFGALSNMDRPTRKRRAAELLETVGMASWGDQRVGSYSKGMMQRIGVAQALVNDPELVVLDEPTDGVDPVGRLEIRNVLADLRQQGRTVFVNSHLLGELELICDRVAILVNGKVARQGTIGDLTVRSQRYEIDVVETADARAGIRKALADGAAVRWSAPNGSIDPGLLADGKWLQIEGITISAGITEADQLQPLLDALRRGNIAIKRVQMMRQSLEDLFVEAVGGLTGGHAAGAKIGKQEARAMNQTLALLVDAYRELNAKKLFWLTMILSGCVMGIFALFGVDDKGYSFLWMHFAGPINVPATIVYRSVFSYLGIGFWLTFCAAILALISTAFIFPDFLTGGTIDLYLSKPISRVRLFLTKYIAGLMFVTLQVGAFSAASFLVLGIRGGVWLPSIFLAIPIVVCFFSYLFSVSVLFGVWTRSTIAALLLTCLFWGLIAATDRAEPWLLLLKTEQQQRLSLMDDRAKVLDGQIAAAQKAPATTDPADAANFSDLQARRASLAERQATTESWLDKLRISFNIVYGIKTVVPKTTDTVDLLDRWLDPTESPATTRRRNRRSASADDPLGMQAEQTSRAEVRDELLNRPLWWVVGTSLAFEAFVLVLAGWIFCRRDY